MNCPEACVVMSPRRMKYCAVSASSEDRAPVFWASTNAFSGAASRSMYCTRPDRPNKLPVNVFKVPAGRPMMDDGSAVPRNIEGTAPPAVTIFLDGRYSSRTMRLARSLIDSIGASENNRTIACHRRLYQGFWSIAARKSTLDCTSEINSSVFSRPYCPTNALSLLSWAKIASISFLALR